ncbi:hypothetical protein ABB37_01811 [Leptomonas pyrrhocoris]|uniref:Uncharacterized protein n=1 Tax=Leptomonas pyrrhocoris TaxID=157538 RepID=A0A0M9G9C9_LEPPY|nr:hypothetical protein ABB37_01811 [Leptomonas pyrrhocoris]KPA85540.1 hypothetical protein ABB37_01811 [Leptomonas pyrrhocoris]|eukprot:XP_015663979.1 hypothetical protein ABB37_01811 [Leptomonas pyrrhocoris]
METEKTESRASPAAELGGSDAAAAAAASPRPTYTACPKWSHDEDNTVTVVQSTHDYTQRVFRTKPSSARWVRGLAEGEDEVPAGTGFRRRTNMHRWEELDDTPDGALQDGSSRTPTKQRPWLFHINVIGVLYLFLLAFRMVKGLHKSYRLDFPSTERQLMTFGRRYGENGISFVMRVAVPLCLPHCVGAAYAMGLSYRLGGAAHNFVCLWGVGLAIISLFAAFTQCSVLFSCCNISGVSHRWECDLPFVFHQVCSVFRFVTPLLALWCVAPVVDNVRGSGWRWKCVLALPCLVASTCVGVSVYAGEPSETLLDVAHGTVLLVWPFFIKACWKQPRFYRVLPPAEKPHED